MEMECARAVFNVSVMVVVPESVIASLTNSSGNKAVIFMICFSVNIRWSIVYRQ